MDEPTPQSTEALALLLEGRLIDWERARSAQEQKMLECYQDVMRIPRDGDSKDSAIAKAKKSANIFIGSTRNKVRAARAKINDALFGNGKLPFDTEPTNEELAEFADVVEDIVTEQLERMDFRRTLKSGVNTLATYGTGFMFGPFVRKERLTETAADNSLGYTQIIEQVYEYDSPYFELGNTLDVYPDPEARQIGKGLGLFTVTMESKHTVQAWKADNTYSNIDIALKTSGGGLNETGSEKAGGMRANIEFWHKNDRVKVARFFGKVPESVLTDTDSEADETLAESDEMVDVIVIMAGGAVVKVSRSPYRKAPAYRCAYEEVEHEIWGVGVAENNIPHQKITNAAFRLFVEGKGMALLGTKSVDRSLFMPTENFIKHPGKVYQMKPGLTPEERKSAIIDHMDVDVTSGWIDVIKVSEQFSDDDTGITKYTQGDDSRNLNKTASGISMIMNASSLPLKEVIQNIDNDWIEPMVESLIEWNIKYLEVETVQKIHGDKHAQIWQQIKQFGKTSFMNWQATGTSSFMQKEVLTSKLNAFSAFAMSSPITAQLIDVRELLVQTWDSLEVGRESPILKQEGDLPPEAVQAVEQIKQQAGQQIEQLQQQLQEMSQKLQQAESGQAKSQMEIEAKMQAANMDAQLQAEKMQKDAEAKREQMVIDAQVEREQMDIDATLALERAQQEAAVKLEVAAMDNRTREEIAKMDALVELRKTGMQIEHEQTNQPPQGGFFTPEQ